MTKGIDFEKLLKDSGMPTTASEVMQEFDATVKAHNLVTNTSRMSPFWRLITALMIKPYLYLKSALVSQVMPNLFLLTAHDEMLDLFGQAVNLPRKPPTVLTGVITFTKSTPDQAVTVKAGSLIQSHPIAGNVYQLKTVAEVTIDAGVPSAKIPVIACGVGADYNLAAGYYRVLAQEINGIASVNNDDDYLQLPGCDLESANDYRERIRNQSHFVGHYHTDAVYRGLISSQTGIAPHQIFFVHDAPRGPGTANAYLLLDDGVASSDFLARVNDHIMTQGHHGHGDDLRCFAMPEVAINLTATLYLPADKMPSDIAPFKRHVADLIRCAFRQNNQYHVNKVNAYSRFSLSTLKSELHREFSELYSIEFDQGDIVSALNVPRLKNLTLIIKTAEGVA